MLLSLPDFAINNLLTFLDAASFQTLKLVSRRFAFLVKKHLEKYGLKKKEKILEMFKSRQASIALQEFYFPYFPDKLGFVYMPREKRDTLLTTLTQAPESIQGFAACLATKKTFSKLCWLQKTFAISYWSKEVLNAALRTGKQALCRYIISYDVDYDYQSLKLAVCIDPDALLCLEPLLVREIRTPRIERSLFLDFLREHGSCTTLVKTKDSAYRAFYHNLRREIYEQKAFSLLDFYNEHFFLPRVAELNERDDQILAGLFLQNNLTLILHYLCGTDLDEKYFDSCYQELFKLGVKYDQYFFLVQLHQMREVYNLPPREIYKIKPEFFDLCSLAIKNKSYRVLHEVVIRYQPTPWRFKVRENKLFDMCSADDTKHLRELLLMIFPQ